MTQPDPMAPYVDPAAHSVEERRKARAVEYGTWVATQDITVGGALAYRAGDPVPASNVETHGYDKDGLVAKTSTKAGQRAAAGQPANTTPEG